MCQDYWERIWSHLRHGKARSITAGSLALRTGIGDKAGTTIRIIIERALSKFSEPIAACNHGYFIVRTQEEVDDYLGELANRAIKIFLRRKEFEKKAGDRGFQTSGNIPDQQTWDEILEMAEEQEADRSLCHASI